MPNNIVFLRHEEGWLRRKVMAAIHVKREAPNLNLGREHHTLPPIYNELLLLSHPWITFI